MLKPDTAEGVDLLSPIDPGTYPATILSAMPKTSKKGGAMLEVKLEVTVNGKIKKRTGYVMVSGPGAGNFDSLLRATHNDALADIYKDGSVSPDMKPDFDEQTLVGQAVNLVFDTQLDNSQTPPVPRDNIKNWLKA